MFMTVPFLQDDVANLSVAAIAVKLLAGESLAGKSGSRRFASG
jgi:hypothetical protein